MIVCSGGSECYWGVMREKCEGGGGEEEGRREYGRGKPLSPRDI